MDISICINSLGNADTLYQRIGVSACKVVFERDSGKNILFRGIPLAYYGMTYSCGMLMDKTLKVRDKSSVILAELLKDNPDLVINEEKSTHLKGYGKPDMKLLRNGDGMHLTDMLSKGYITKVREGIELSKVVDKLRSNGMPASILTIKRSKLGVHKKLVLADDLNRTLVYAPVHSVVLTANGVLDLNLSDNVLPLSDYLDTLTKLNSGHIYIEPFNWNFTKKIKSVKQLKAMPKGVDVDWCLKEN